jgi:hypothetical protein
VPDSPAEVGGPDTGLPETGTPAGDCPEQPVRRATGGVELAVQVEFTVGGRPMVFGEPNATAAGPPIIPTNLRFYLSEPVALTADGRQLPLDALDAAGNPARYGVLLLNAEDPESLRFKLVVPPGAHEGLGFLFGLKDACNARMPGNSKPPLTDSSQMTWPHSGPVPIGYLFLRLESRLAGAGSDGGARDGGALDGGASNEQGVVHMGGMVGRAFAPEVKASGPFASAPGGRGFKLRVSLDEIMKGAAMAADVSGFIGPPTSEAIAGERLRKNAGKVSIFTLVPASP